MTLQEVAATLGLSEKTLRHCFVRTQQNLAKKGIILMRWGQGKKAEYEIEYPRLEEIELKEEED